MTAPPVSMADADGIAGPRRIWAITSVLTGMVLVVLDAAIANVALPTIARSLQVTPALSVLVLTAYQLGLVVALLPAAALGESLGCRKVFSAGTVLFIVASRLCALAPTLPWLVAARFLQGLGGATIMALGMALLRFSVPQHRLGAAIGWNALTVALASAVGPTIGATILSVADWTWLFAVNVPVGAIVLLASRALPDVRASGRHPDAWSVALNACVFAALVGGGELAPSRPVPAALLFIGAAGCAMVLVRREAGGPAPLVPLDLLARPRFRVSVIASVLCFAGQAAGLVALPFHLQHAFGLPPLVTGLYLTAWPLAVALAGPVAGRLANHVQTAWLCLAGGTGLAIGLGLAAFLPLHGQPLALALCGLGFGVFNVPNNRNLSLAAPLARSGAAGGLQGVARLTGQMSGAVVMTMLFDMMPLDVAPRVGLAVGAALALAAGLASLVRAGVHEARPDRSREARGDEPDSSSLSRTRPGPSSPRRSVRPRSPGPRRCCPSPHTAPPAPCRGRC